MCSSLLRQHSHVTVQCHHRVWILGLLPQTHGLRAHLPRGRRGVVRRSAGENATRPCAPKNSFQHFFEQGAVGLALLLLLVFDEKLASGKYWELNVVCTSHLHCFLDTRYEYTDRVKSYRCLRRNRMLVFDTTPSMLYLSRLDGRCWSVTSHSPW